MRLPAQSAGCWILGKEGAVMTLRHCSLGPEVTPASASSRGGSSRYRGARGIALCLARGGGSNCIVLNNWLFVWLSDIDVSYSCEYHSGETNGHSFL